MTPQELHHDALRGRFDLDRTRQLARGNPEDRGWAYAVRSALALAAPEHGDPPHLEELQDAAGDRDAGRGLAAACAHLERLAALTEHPAHLERLLQLHRQCVQSETDQLWVECGEMLYRWVAGALAPCPDALANLETRASQVGQAYLVVEVAALRAWAYLEGGDRDNALRHARRAARMARTEDFPQPEYLAYLTLARVRRHCGRPHLAVRILDALRNFAPGPWSSLIGWEYLLADGLECPPDLLPHIPPSGRALRGAFLSARQGDSDSLAQSGEIAVAGAPPRYAAETTSAVALLSPHPVADLPPPAEDWAAGRQHAVPFGLGSLRGSATGLVAARPGVVARRVLGLSEALLGTITRSSRPGRIETGFCVLACEGPLTKEAFFEKVYGFPYDAELHRGSLEVVVHRLRDMCGDNAHLDRHNERLNLEVLRPMVVPDPRCDSQVDDRLLRALAKSGTLSARELAQAAGIPLRTAQAMLKQLVEEGACVAHRRGRSVEYAVEDTTFSEPTNVGRS